MKLRAALLVLVTSCCTPTKPAPPTPTCVTRCGMTGPAGLCAQLVEFETLAVVRLGKVPGWTRHTVCGAFKGWSVSIEGPNDPPLCRDGWFEGGICVIGYTRIRTHTMAVQGPTLNPPVLGHEMIHVIDYQTRGYAGHCRWAERGIMAALLALTGVEDSTNSDCVDTAHDGGL